MPRVLGPLNRVTAILVTRLAAARGEFSSRKTPKMAIHRDFPGLRAFSANFATNKIEERKISQPMVKSAARFGAPEPSYGHFSHPAGQGRGKFSSRKTPQMATNRDFPELRAFSANVARDKNEEREIPQPMVKNAARSGAPKPSYGHFSHPAGHGRGKFSSRKTPEMAINCDFPELRAFSANFARDKNEEREIPQPVVKSTARFGARKSSYGHFSYPAGCGQGRVFKPKNTQNGNTSRFPGATCIFSKFCDKQNRSAQNSAADGQKCRAFWGP